MHSSEGQTSGCFFSDDHFCVNRGGVAMSLDGVHDPLSFTSEGKESIDEDRTDKPASGL